MLMNRSFSRNESGRQGCDNLELGSSKWSLLLMRKRKKNLGFCCCYSNLLVFFFFTLLFLENHPTCALTPDGEHFVAFSPPHIPPKGQAHASPSFLCYKRNERHMRNERPMRDLLTLDDNCLWVFCFFSGEALLSFKRGLLETHGAMSNWNESDPDPCGWWGVECHASNRRVSKL